ncbi:hypothetical protein M2165_002876 [Variovorax sp. TBS-050B]|nr:hypothetical protein [Variovorax sp. TBS-050B]
MGTSGSSGERCGRGHGERAELAGLDLAHGRRGAVEHHVDLAADDVDVRLRTALVGHVDRLHAGGEVEGFAAHVLGAADARRGVLEAAGLRGHGRDEVLHRPVGRAGGDHEHVGHHGHEADGLEVLQRVVLELEDVRRHGLCRVGGQQQRAAVGRGAGREFARDGVGSAGPVLHGHRLLERGGELVRQHPRQDVGAAARRGADEDAYRLVGVGRLRAGRGGRKRQHGDAGRAGERGRRKAHGVVSGLFVPEPTELAPGDPIEKAGASIYFCA